MQILKVGDKGQAICETCKNKVSTTYRLRDVPFSDGRGKAKEILAGVCDSCENVVSIPHQSTPAIKRALEKRRQPVESRVPAHMLDILNLASAEVGADTDFSPYIIKYYLHALAREEISSGQLAKYLKSELAQGKAEKRISLKGQSILDDVRLLKKHTQLEKTSDLIRSVILKINDDIVQHHRTKPINALKSIVAACQ